MDLFRLRTDENYDENCGQILLTTKGRLVFYCTICGQYRNYENFITHLLEKCLQLLDDDLKQCVTKSSLTESTCAMFSSLPKGCQISQEKPVVPQPMVHKTSAAVGEDKNKGKVLIQSVETLFAPLVQKEAVENDKHIADEISQKKPVVPQPIMHKKSAAVGEDKKNGKVLIQSVETLLAPLVQKEAVENDKHIADSNSSERMNDSADMGMDNFIGSDASEVANDDGNVYETETLIFKNDMPINQEEQCSDSSVQIELVELLASDEEVPGNRKMECNLESGEKREGRENSSIKWRKLRNFPMPTDLLNTFPEKRKFKCSICTSSFKNINARNQHVKRHSKERPFSCPECGKQFYTSTEVRIHQRVHQKPESKFLCTLCGLTFATGYRLKIHMKKHNNQRDFVCEVCNKAFFEGTRLRRHMKYHSTERPFSCEICESTFRMKTHLKLHLKHHENKREFKCQYCEAAYNISDSLKFHIKVKHGHVSK